MKTQVNSLIALVAAAALTGCVTESPKVEENLLATAASTACGNKYYKKRDMGGGRCTDIAGNSYNTRNHSCTGIKTTSGGYHIYETDEYSWWDISGGAVRITESFGKPWVVNNVGNIFKKNPSWTGGWQHYKGIVASEIGGNKNGEVYAVSTAGRIHRLSGSSWGSPIGSLTSAVKVAVDGNNTPWASNIHNVLFRWNGSSWLQVGDGTTRATDIGAVGNGVAFITGAIFDTPGNYSVRRISPEGCIDDVIDSDTNQKLAAYKISGVSETEFVFIDGFNNKVYLAEAQ